MDIERTAGAWRQKPLIALGSMAGALLFRRDEAAATAARPTAVGEQREQQPGGRRLCCRACRAAITDHAERMLMNGSHAHTFTNPAGIAFRIGCFRSAPGCRALGPATYEHTWFADHAWQIAVCRGCASQLGWRFKGPSGSMYGLILDRLAEARDG